jgi:monofunctional biosynthetic peptidoglycan transglycosylase
MFPKLMRRLFWFSTLGFLIYLLWPYDVFDLKDHNPETTSLIELRRQDALAHGHKFAPQMTWKRLAEISPALVHAIILAEDDTFYQHHGFDLEQIQIAIKENWQKKRYVYGGSTITQQLARTLFLRPRKTILRKLKEAVLTVYLESTLSKKRILELYLNVIEWGPGIYGAEAASQYYFWKPAADLTPDEAVSLASILPSPRRWSPFSEKAFMARRRTQLMERMKHAGYAPFFEDGTPAWTLPFAPVMSPPSDLGPAPDLNSLSAPDHAPAPDHEPPTGGSPLPGTPSPDSSAAPSQ